MSSPFQLFLDTRSWIKKESSHLYSQIGLAPAFEEEYLTLRRKEGRFYEDEVVARLPEIKHSHVHSQEWKVRKNSADRLLQYLKGKNKQTILEIGCGNGWLINRLNHSLQKPCCGIDINKTELIQASRVFKDAQHLDFVYADILSAVWNGMQADVILMGSSIQYFKDLSTLLKKLQALLSSEGEIHIFDSPVYKKEEADDARQRSCIHFDNLGIPSLKFRYHHHTWDAFREFDFKLLHNPRSPVSRLKTRWSNGSPFPWIKIMKG